MLPISHFITAFATLVLLVFQVTGEIIISEFASLGEHDDICFAVSTTGSGAGHLELKQTVQALQPQIYRLLDQFKEELQEN